MNKIVTREAPNRATGRILAIEPDAYAAATLADILHQHAGVDVEIVASIAAAIRALESQIPDLLLTSTFLPPADEALLTRHLNQMPDARHVQLITVPYFIDAEEAQATRSSGRVLSFLRRRSASVRPRCDVRTLCAHIEEYLSRAKTIRLDAANGGVSWTDTDASPTRARRLIRSDAASGPGPSLGAALVPGSAMVLPSDRRRARRRMGDDVNALWTVKIPGNSQARVVDISSSGVLLETTSRIVNGSTVDLQLLGQDTNVSIPARMLRSQRGHRRRAGREVSGGSCVRP